VAGKLEDQYYRLPVHCFVQALDLDIPYIFFISNIVSWLQFIPRKERMSYFASVSKRLRAEMAPIASIYYLSDNKVVFFILTKEENERLIEALRRYAKEYSLIMGSDQQ
jgi:hypothetical protein